VLLLSGLLLGACATLPDVSQRPPQHALPAASDGSLSRLAANSVPLDGPSGFRLMVSGDEALQARLALIERATVSLGKR
jgi:putative cardiolipin synthase